jgi:hypothetical protein
MTATTIPQESAMKLEGKIILGQFHITQESPDFFSVNYEYENGSMTLAGSASTLKDAIEVLTKRHNQEEEDKLEFGTQGFASELAEDGDDDDDDEDRDENEVYFDERDECDDRSDDYPDVRRAEY